MINILVCIEDVEYCKNIINNLNKMNDNIRIYRIFNHFEEVNNVDNFADIDLYVFHISNISNKKSFETIQKFLNSDSVILILENTDFKFNDKIDYILRNKNLKYDITLLNDIINQKNNTFHIKNKIQNELNVLGYNTLYIGTTYITEAIYLLYNYETTNAILEKDIYSIIAKKYNTTTNNIKCNIINATNSMYYDCNEKVLEDYIKSPFKPGPKKVMLIIVYRLKLIENISNTTNGKILKN